MLRWQDIYEETALYQTAVRLYTKPLFDRRKALVVSSDDRTLYDFARRGLRNLGRLHRRLESRRFRFRPALAVTKNFNSRRRTLYIFPWEERLVSLLLYRGLSRVWHDSFSDSCFAYRWRGYGLDRCQRDIRRVIRSRTGPLYVLKRDIREFFASIDHAILFEQLRSLIEPGDYLEELLSQCIRFPHLDDQGQRTATRGVPFGTPIACLLANLYLRSLDQRLERVGDSRFFRYADDLLVLAETESAWRRASDVFDNEIARLRLTSKEKQHRDFLLTGSPTRSASIVAREKFRHLGLEFRADGSVGLARDKFRKICNLFRYGFRRRKGTIRRLTDPAERARAAIRVAEDTLHRGVRNVAIIDYYLKHVSDEGQLRRLDRWLAEEVLSIAFGGGHKKGYFRRIPYRRLRQWGLPSLVHRRRLILHGHIESPFFVWKSEQAQRGFGGKAARSKRQRDSAFSQCPEAAVEKTS